MEVRTIRKMVIKRCARDAKANPGVAVIALEDHTVVGILGRPLIEG
jgi:hypothetical protein